MEKLVLIDGNSIMNRAFYGIMGSKMLTTRDGKYTNAVYGFLAILFKIQEDINPEYLVVTFDIKGPTARHEMYDKYKANRKGMPDELAEQMPIIKQILKSMNIQIVEKQGYEGDDIIGTLSKYGEENGLQVVILSGDRDNFQLASENTTIRIPRTKMGKTETEDYDRNKILEEYGLEPIQLKDVKALQGDSSDNIPGVPGIGEKTALTLIKKYNSIENLYREIEEGTDSLKGKQRQNIEENKELAFLSKELGTINRDVPVEKSLETFKVEEWNKEEVLEIFKELNFNRYIERFDLANSGKKEDNKELYIIKDIESLEEIKDIIFNQNKIIYTFGTKPDEDNNKIIKEKIISLSVYNKEENLVYYINNVEKDSKILKEIFENSDIAKYSHNMTRDYIILKQENINISNMKFDIMVASYILDPNNNKLNMEMLLFDYLEINQKEYLSNLGIKENQPVQMNLFDIQNSNSNNEGIELEKQLNTLYAYAIGEISDIVYNKLKEIDAWDLFQNIDMPTVEVLSDMQWNGIRLDIKELDEFGDILKQRLEELTKEIYQLCDEEFNINSTKQLGEVLFEKMQLPVIKKNKSGYSTDVDVLEKLKKEHPVIEKILEYRQLMKLNSTYIEGLKPYVNINTGRIHSFFHQTITATGRISSTEPNLQNIPTRVELGKMIRKAFKPEEGYIYVDADYSQIELRVLAHISEDEHMIEAFNNNQDIHKQAASKVFDVPMEEVTKEQRANAKAVNFGIVYGISDFGLGEQLGISRKKAQEYIDQYLTEYSGIKTFMDEIIEQAKDKGYVETLFKRRRYIPELKSNNYMVRQFGSRAAMNTPIQGTAADIMKIAMIKVFNEIRERKLESKIILQVHDEMMIETKVEELQEVKDILKRSMESAIELKVPLIAEVSEALSWYDCK